MSAEDAINEIEIRAKLREILVEMAKKNGEGYYGPEWIVLANDHLSRNLSSRVTDKDTILRTFRERLGCSEGVQ